MTRTVSGPSEHAHGRRSVVRAVGISSSFLKKNATNFGLLVSSGLRRGLILGLAWPDVQQSAWVHGGTAFEYREKQMRAVGNAGPRHAAERFACSDSAFSFGNRRF